MRRRRRPRGGHAPVGQVGPQLRRVRRRPPCADALADAGLDWHGRRVRRPAPTPSATATRATSPAPPSPRRWAGPACRWRSCYAACASGATAMSVARARILAGACDVALVVGADTTPKGFFAREGRRSPRRPGLAALPPPRRHQPDLLRPLRPPPHGPLRRHRRGLRPGQGEERRTAWPTPTPATARRSRVEEVLASPIVADPLRLLEICATCDGGAAVVADEPGRGRAPAGTPTRVKVAAISTVTPTYPNTVHRDAQLRHRLRRGVRGARADLPRLDRAPRPTRRPGIGPEDVDLAEVYDLSTALELDWYENIGLCKRGRGREARCATATPRIGGRIPVNPSGGLACFGEAIPAQAIAQVCELTWQLRGQAGERQVEGAQVGVTVNQGLFGHGSSVIVTQLDPSGGNSPRIPGVIASDEEKDTTTWLRPTSSKPSAPRRPPGRRAGPASTPPTSAPTSLNALIDRTGVDPAAVDDVVLRLRRHHRPAGRRHRPHRLAGRRPARGGARHHRSTASAARPSRPCTSPPRP